MIVVRHACGADRDAVYDICRRTGNAGDDATGMLEHGELYGHLYAGQYLTLEPDFAVVATLDGEVVGYVVGALDTLAFEARCTTEWWPPLRHTYTLPAAGTELDRRLTAAIHEPYETHPRLAARFPSHLHINLLPQAQGRGAGRALMATIVGALAAAGSSGVHLGVDPRNTRAMGFYQHLGWDRRDHPAGVLFTRELAGTAH